MAQSFRISFQRLSDPKEFFDELKRPVGRAATKAIREVGEQAHASIRRQVEMRFRDSPHRYRGQDLKNAFRAASFPDPKSGRFSYEPAVNLWATPRWAEIFQTGGAVFPKLAGALAIPLPDAEEHGLARGTQKNDPFDVLEPWQHHRKRSLTDLARVKFGHTFLIDADGGGKIVAAEYQGRLLRLFKLQRSVRLRKRLRFYETAEAAMRLLPRQFDRELSTLSD